MALFLQYEDPVINNMLEVNEGTIYSHSNRYANQAVQVVVQ